MGQEAGEVIRIKQNKIVVRLTAGDHCQVCAAKSMCAFQGTDTKSRIIELPGAADIREGAKVQLEYKESSRILAAFLVFFLPILFLIAGYFIGNTLSDYPQSGILGALAGIILSGGILFALNRWLSRSKLFLPRITGWFSTK